MEDWRCDGGGSGAGSTLSRELFYTSLMELAEAWAPCESVPVNDGEAGMRDVAWLDHLFDTIAKPDAAKPASYKWKDLDEVACVTEVPPPPPPSPPISPAPKRPSIHRQPTRKGFAAASQTQGGPSALALSPQRSGDQSGEAATNGAKASDSSLGGAAAVGAWDAAQTSAVGSASPSEARLPAAPKGMPDGATATTKEALLAPPNSPDRPSRGAPRPTAPSLPTAPPPVVPEGSLSPQRTVPNPALPSEARAGSGTLPAPTATGEPRKSLRAGACGAGAHGGVEGGRAEVSRLPASPARDRPMGPSWTRPLPATSGGTLLADASVQPMRFSTLTPSASDPSLLGAPKVAGRRRVGGRPTGLLPSLSAASFSSSASLPPAHAAARGGGSPPVAYVSCVASCDTATPPSNANGEGGHLGAALQRPIPAAAAVAGAGGGCGPGSLCHAAGPWAAPLEGLLGTQSLSTPPQPPLGVVLAGGPVVFTDDIPSHPSRPKLISRESATRPNSPTPGGGEASPPGARHGESCRSLQGDRLDGSPKMATGVREAGQRPRRRRQALPRDPLALQVPEVERAISAVRGTRGSGGSGGSSGGGGTCGSRSDGLAVKPTPIGFRGLESAPRANKAPVDWTPTQTALLEAERRVERYKRIHRPNARIIAGLLTGVIGPPVDGTAGSAPKADVSFSPPTIGKVDDAQDLVPRGGLRWARQYSR